MCIIWNFLNALPLGSTHCKGIQDKYGSLNIEYWGLNIKYWGLNIEYWCLNIKNWQFEYWILKTKYSASTGPNNIDALRINIANNIFDLYTLSWCVDYLLISNNLNDFPFIFFSCYRSTSSRGIFHNGTQTI